MSDQVDYKKYRPFYFLIVLATCGTLILLLSQSFSLYRYHSKVQSGGIATTGMVTDVYEVGVAAGRGFGSAPVVDYEFQDQTGSRIHKVEEYVKRDLHKNLQPGQTVDIMYVPAEPSMSELMDNYYATDSLPLFMALALFFCLIIALGLFGIKKSFE